MTETLSPFTNTNFEQLDFEAAQHFSREAMAWLPKQVQKYHGEIVAHELQRETPGEGLIIERLQSWGGIDERTIQAAGHSVEVGGPSKVSRHDILPGFKPDYVSNIVAQSMSGRAGQLATGAVDLVADARQLPFADLSLGSLKASHLPGVRHPNQLDEDLRYNAILEARRIVKRGGYLIREGGTTHDFDTIRANEFEPVSLLVVSSVNQDAVADKSYRPRIEVNGVFQKQA